MTRNIVRIISATGFLAAVVFSHELWFGVARELPRAPLVYDLPVVLERILALVLAVSLCLTALSSRRVAPAVALASFLLLAVADQNRLQPWAYQFSQILLILTIAKDNDESASLIGILIATLYLWSGIQKLNYNFAFETLPMLLAPIGEIAPSLPAAVAIAVTEAVIGLSLLLEKTRRYALFAAVAMHSAILFLLIAAGRNHIVWIWNVVLILLVAAIFGRFQSSVFARFREAKGGLKVFVGAVAILPALSFAGLWDMYLSGALYSGNVVVAAVRVDDESLAAFPPAARKAVLTTKSGERFVTVAEWSLNEMRTPVYPEKRVFMVIFREICRRNPTPDRLEMVLKERPNLLDGKFEIERVRCSPLP